MSIIGWLILGLIAGFVASKIVNKTGDAVLRGKTGTGGPDNARLNWFVGYLERGKRRYVFATNIEAANITGPLTARHITEQILHDLKLF